MVRVLLAHNADVNAKDNKGLTPFAFAKSTTKLKTPQQKEIAALLRQAESRH
jgi:hypothetical protein